MIFDASKQVEYFLFITISWQNCDKAMLDEGDISVTKLRHSYKCHNSLHPELFFLRLIQFPHKITTLSFTGMSTFLANSNNFVIQL